MTYGTLISTQTIAASGTYSITFNSIPQTYTDLIVVFAVREYTAQSALTRISFNGVTTNLSSRILTGNGASASSSTAASTIDALADQSTDTANTFSNGQFYIPNYAGSTAKTISSDAVNENNGTTAFQRIIAGLWNSTAAITSLTLYTPNGDMAAGSTASLYGIK